MIICNKLVYSIIHYFDFFIRWVLQRTQNIKLAGENCNLKAKIRYMFFEIRGGFFREKVQLLFPNHHHSTRTNEQCPDNYL